jgi:lysyl oxidase
MSRSLPFGAIVAGLVALVGLPAVSLAGPSCRHGCAEARRECRRSLRLATRHAARDCAGPGKAGCRAAVRAALRTQAATCTMTRAECRRCCASGVAAEGCLAPLVVFCTSDADCDDGSVCTDDFCDPTLGCLHAPVPQPCSDGNSCTASDVCMDGTCIGGVAAAGCSACQAAAVIPPQGGTFVGETSGAGSQAGSCSDSGVAPERVYQWTPAVSGSATIGTCGDATAYDSVVYVRGGACEGGAELACNDDTPGCAVADGTTGADHHGSSVVTAVTANQTYFIFVDGFAGKGGAYGLTVVPPSDCGNGVREVPEQCDGADSSECPSHVCTASCTCQPPAGGLPDLIPMVSDVSLDRGASVSSADVAEGCAAATSGVDLLRFAVTTRNIGSADLILGDPQCPDCTTHPDAPCGNPQFICSPAAGHNHGHWSNYARYELVDASNVAVVVGHKQGFCLRDSVCGAPKYTCTNQGLTAGCDDVYGASLGCQYIDVTGVPDGAYKLRVTVDPFNRVTELDESNNVVTVPVTIGTSTCPAPTDVPSGGGTFTGTTSGTSALAASCAAESGSAPEQLFRWVPALTGQATLSTCGAGTAFDTVLSVRQGDCTGTELACNDDTDGCGTGDTCAAASHHGSSVSLAVTAGTTYTIAVDGFGGSCGGSEGAFQLTIVPPSGTTTTTVPGATTTTSSTVTTTSTATTSPTATTSSTVTTSSTATTRSTATTSSTATSTSTSTSSTMPGTNHPPDCRHASAGPDLIWPPSHDMRPVSIEDVRDPDGDPVTITVTGIMQNEPRDGAGDGSTCGDASGIGSALALVRAERSGGGLGRIYRIAFSAIDGRGGECHGTVQVCIPHDHGHGSTCLDLGLLFDSIGDCRSTEGASSGPAEEASATVTPPVGEHLTRRERKLLARALRKARRKQHRLDRERAT